MSGYLPTSTVDATGASTVSGISARWACPGAATARDPGPRRPHPELTGLAVPPAGRGHGAGTSGVPSEVCLTWLSTEYTAIEPVATALGAGSATGAGVHPPTLRHRHVTALRVDHDRRDADRRAALERVGLERAIERLGRLAGERHGRAGQRRHTRAGVHHDRLEGRAVEVEQLHRLGGDLPLARTLPISTAASTSCPWSHRASTRRSTWLAGRHS